MKRREEIDINWGPKRLDYFLQKNYSYSLWHFAFSIYGIFLNRSFDWRIKKVGEWTLSLIHI